MRIGTILRGFVVAALLSCRIAGADAAERATPPDFSFGVIADVHYADGDPYRKNLKKLEECVADFNSHDLGFTIQLGDFIHHDLASFDGILPAFNRLTMPRHHVLGNHDFDPIPREEVLSRLGLEAAYYSFSHGGWRFVVLDTIDISVYGGWPKESENYKQAQRWVEELKSEPRPRSCNKCGAIGEQQKQWLRATLREACERGERVIVFGHIPVAASPAGEWALVHNHDEIREVLESSGCVVASFSGHAEGDYAYRNGIHYIRLASMGDGYDDNAYAIVDLHQDRLEIRGVGRVPSRELQVREAPILSSLDSGGSAPQDSSPCTPD